MLQQHFEKKTHKTATKLLHEEEKINLDLDLFLNNSIPH